MYQIRPTDTSNWPGLPVNLGFFYERKCAALIIFCLITLNPTQISLFTIFHQIVYSTLSSVCRLSCWSSPFFHFFKYYRTWVIQYEYVLDLFISPSWPLFHLDFPDILDFVQWNYQCSCYCCHFSSIVSDIVFFFCDPIIIAYSVSLNAYSRPIF